MPCNYYTGSPCKIAWRIAMMILRKIVQSNIFAHLLWVITECRI
jgi:hypothetical protein